MKNDNRIKVGSRVSDRYNNILLVESIQNDVCECIMEYGIVGMSYDKGDISLTPIQNLDIGICIRLYPDEQIKLIRKGNEDNSYSVDFFIETLLIKVSEYIKKYNYPETIVKEFKNSIVKIMCRTEEEIEEDLYEIEYPFRRGIVPNQFICEFSTTEEIIDIGIITWGDNFLFLSVLRILIELKDELDIKQVITYTIFLFREFK